MEEEKCYPKSKSEANWALSRWKAGSWAAAWALLARDSWDIGPPPPPPAVPLPPPVPDWSRPMPKVLTRRLTNWNISGGI